MTDYPRSSNPFYSETNDDEYGYGSNKPGRQGGYDPSDRRGQIMEQIDNSENRQLESTRRALASIYDSEGVGVATAEELLRQGEQLDNIERKTDDINQSMTTSQKHLNNIKSVFGGIKNWWSGGNKSEQKQPEERQSKLKDTLERENLRDSGSHPAMRLKSEDCRGFYQDDDDDLDGRFMAGARKPANTGAGQSRQQMFQPVTSSKKEEQLEENLDLMSDGMSKLKGLAMALGDEIGTQNDQLDRINVKVDTTSTKLEGQNKQMRGILYKK